MPDLDVPPPHRRVLPHVAISEQGLAELLLWILGKVKKTAAVDLTRYLHWGTNNDDGNEGLTLNSSRPFSFNSQGGMALNNFTGTAALGGVNTGSAVTVDDNSGDVQIAVAASSRFSLTFSGATTPYLLSVSGGSPTWTLPFNADEWSVFCGGGQMLTVRRVDAGSHHKVIVGDPADPIVAFTA